MNIILRLKALVSDASRKESSERYASRWDANTAVGFNQSISEQGTQTVMVGNFEVTLGKMAQRAAVAATAHGADAKQALETALQVQVAAESGKDVEIDGGTIRIGHRTGDAVSICFD